MSILRRATLVCAAAAAGGLGWAAFEPLTESCKDYSPNVKKLARIRRNVIRWGIFTEDYGSGTLANALRAYITWRTKVEPENPEIQRVNSQLDNVPVRVYLPAKRCEGGRCIVYIHGGGAVIGTLDSYDTLVRKLALATNSVVVSIEYRLSPENKYPAHLDDCEKAVRCLVQNPAQWGIDPNRIVVSGDSAGGHMSVALSLRLRKNPLQANGKRVNLKGQVLFYPFVQAASFNTSSWQENWRDPFLPASLTARFILMGALGMDYYDRTARAKAVQYLMSDCFMVDPRYAERINRVTENGKLFPKTQDTTKVRCKFEGAELDKVGKMLEPIMAEDFSVLLVDSFEGVPPALIISADHDVLRDDGAMLEKRLKDAKVPATFITLPLYHGFMGVEPEEALKHVKVFLKDL